MKKILFMLSLLIIGFYQQPLLAKAVAITIDDLPFVGSNNTKRRTEREHRLFMHMLEILQHEHVPAAGFVVPGTVAPGQWALIQAYRDSGNIIANHTYHHYNLNSTSASRFEQDIAAADRALEPYITYPKYFRYPFLHTGNNANKYWSVRRFLTSHHYVIAPVTIDSNDWKYLRRFYRSLWPINKPLQNRIINSYLSHIRYVTKKQERQEMKQFGRHISEILLIHMNRLNADCLQDVIHLYRQMGYHFITLTEAMKDPYYHRKQCFRGNKC